MNPFERDWAEMSREERVEHRSEQPHLPVDNRNGDLGPRCIDCSGQGQLMVSSLQLPEWASRSMVGQLVKCKRCNGSGIEPAKVGERS